MVMDYSSNIARLRLGIFANDVDNCETCNSWLGFGARYFKTNVTVGNFARYDTDNGWRDSAAVGYILVA